MSLLVWLPGTKGNIANQGLYTLPTPSYNNTASTTTGLFGKAFKNCAIWHLDSSIISATDSWSVATWVKYDSAAGQYNNIIFAINGASTSDVQIYMSIVSNTQLNIGRGEVSSLTYNPTTTFTAGTWYHVAATCDGTTLSLYLNGERVGTKTVSRTITAYNNFGIGCRSNNAAGTAMTGWGPEMNDFRFYNHALSVKEVKEISKGLILHYPLNIENTKNLLTTYNNITSSFSGSYIVVQTLTNSQLAALGITPGTTVTYSARVTSSNNQKIRIRLQWWASNSVRTGSTTNSVNSYNNTVFQKVASTWPTSSDYANARLELLLDNNWSTSAQGSVTVNFQKLEIGDNPNPVFTNEDIMHDCSGYGNHGEIINTITPGSNSPRYNAYSIFDSTRLNWIRTPLLANGFKPTKNITFAAWVKPDAVPSSEQNIICNYESGGCGLDIGTNGKYKMQIYAGGYKQAYDTTQVTPNVWTHVVGTYDGANIKLYVNGVLKGTTACTTNITHNANTPFAVACNPTASKTHGGGQFTGGLSDLRAYATALSAADVLELYNSPEMVDKMSNNYCYEMVENTASTSPAFKKTGVEETKTFSETTSGNNIKNTSINMKQFIEI